MVPAPNLPYFDHYFDHLGGPMQGAKAVERVSFEEDQFCQKYLRILQMAVVPFRSFVSYCVLKFIY